MILLMASAGLRRAALTTLRLADLQFIDKFSLYKIAVYKREQEQYTTYCTPECAKVINQYLDSRKRLGEQLQPNSILFRAEFDTFSCIRIARPRPINPDTVSRTVTVLLDKTGIRPRAQGWKRSDVMQCHGFRKFFKTTCINAGMNPLYSEYLMGHRSGLTKSYFKPSDMELLEGNDKALGYISAINGLTINEEFRLRKKVDELIKKKDEIAIS
jgi:integrase